MTDVKTGNRRLRLLAKFLETVPPSRFDMGEWTGSGWKGAQDLSCGTSACMMGWAATVPEFQRVGFGLVEGTFSNIGIPTLVARDGHRWRGFRAAEVLFGLDEDEARELFDSHEGMVPRDATPAEAATYLISFAASREP
jgi:hypothetical protein